VSARAGQEACTAATANSAAQPPSPGAEFRLSWWPHVGIIQPMDLSPPYGDQTDTAAPMIRFHCTRCGWPVRVADTHAGKQGRCPSCKHTVRIPGEPVGNSQALAELISAAEDRAAAPADQGDSTHADIPRPPSVVEPSLDGDEDDLPQRGASDETDILPAEEIITVGEAKARRRAARRKARLASRQASRRARGPISRLLVVIAVAAVTALVAVVVILMLVEQ